MRQESVGILHYSAPPVIGGVESVMKAHTVEIIRAGYTCAIISGRGDKSGLPADSEFISIPEIDSNYPEVQNVSRELEVGQVPENFDGLEQKLTEKLKPIVEALDHLIVHNVMTKHFNLPLTKAIHRLNDDGSIKNLIAWCHDFTWTSPSSRSKVYEGEPWNLLKTKWVNTQYVTISIERQQALAGLFGCPDSEIPVVYNGVNPRQLLGITETGWGIIQRLGLLESDINVLMPVRVTEAKNIEFAIEVAASLKSKGLDSRFVITGPPDPHDASSIEYFNSLKQYRDQLNVRENVRFIFDSGLEPGKPFIIDEPVVGDLYRVSDVMFMPSHREGFGMPVLEAGLVNIPVVCREVPAAMEIAGRDALIFSDEASSDDLAGLISKVLEKTSTSSFKRQVRKEYSWQALFENEIQPLLVKGE